ncbi:MAG: hypothetical protein AAGD07_22350 [Planctomycetota bacterium]
MKMKALMFGLVVAVTPALAQGAYESDDYGIPIERHRSVPDTMTRSSPAFPFLRGGTPTVNRSYAPASRSNRSILPRPLRALLRR